MAICIAGGGVTNIRGSISGNTFSRSRSGMTVRARTVPTNTRSTSQVKSRSLFSFLAETWHTQLTNLQRTNWTSYADAISSKNKLGEKIHLTGQLQFLRSNQCLMTAGLALNKDGPSVLALPEKDPSIFCFCEVSPEISVYYNDVQPWVKELGSALCIYMSKPQSMTRNYFAGPWKFAGAILGSDTAPPASPQVINSPNTMVAGQKVFIKAGIVRADGRITEGFCPPPLEYNGTHYQLTGQLTPEEAAGDFFLTGIYNAKPYLKNTASTWFVWCDSNWFITPVLGVQGSNGWIGPAKTLPYFGDYVPYGIYQGKASLSTLNFRTVPISHQYYKPANILMLERCDDSSRWSMTGGSVSYDTEHVRTYGEVKRSVKFTANGSSGEIKAILDHGSTVDATRKFIELLFYIPPGTGTADPDGSSGLNYMDIRLYNTDIANRFRISTFLKDYCAINDTRAGWWRVVLPMQINETWGWSSVGSPDVSNIRTINLDIILKNVNSTMSIVLDRWSWLTTPFTKGYFCARIDSTIKEVLDVAAYFQSKGFVGNFGIQPSLVGFNPAYLSVSDVKSLMNSGHQISLYSGASPTWISKTRAQKIAVLEEWQTFIANNSLILDDKVVFASGGPGLCPWDTDVLKLLYNIVHLWGEASPFYQHLRSLLYPALRSDRNLWSFFQDSATPPTQLATLISDAENYKSVLSFGAHIDTAAKRTGLYSILDSLAASSLTSVTGKQISSGELT